MPVPERVGPVLYNGPQEPHGLRHLAALKRQHGQPVHRVKEGVVLIIEVRLHGRQDVAQLFFGFFQPSDFLQDTREAVARD